MSSQTNDTEDNGLRDAVNAIDNLPVSVLVDMMAKTPTAFVHPFRLEKLFRKHGFGDAADKIIENMGSPGFWKALVQRCFPRVSVLPAFIKARLRSGKFYRDRTPHDYVRSPDTEPMFAVDQAWYNTMRYILSILKNVTVNLELGGEYHDPGEWNPPLQLGPDAIITCADYTLSPHIMTHEHYADGHQKVPFLFHIDFEQTSDESDFSEYDDLSIGLADETNLPTAIDLGKGVESDNSTIGELVHGTNGGALVFEDDISAQFPFNDVLKLHYEIRWAILILTNRPDRVVPRVRAKISASLKLWPGHINNHVLHAIDLREERRAFRPERLPLEINVYDGSSPESDGVQVSLTVLDSIDIFPAPFEEASLMEKIYAELIEHESLADSVRNGDYTLEIPYEWDGDGISKTITLPSVASPIDSIKHMLIGEIVGPPRPYRPVHSKEPHYEWFTGDQRGPEHIVIKVVTRARL